MATDRKDFSQEEINEVWEKAIPQPKNNPDLFRKDYAGAWIVFHFCSTSASNPFSSAGTGFPSDGTIDFT